MPYSGPNDEKLPENVIALPEAARAQWVEVWNSVYTECISDGGERVECERTAFVQANGVIDEDEMSAFMFAELPADVHEVQILRAGVFTDRNGREITVTPDDIDALVRNFAAGVAGQDVPFDVDHERREAAGWLRELRRVGDVLAGVVEWNELGKHLIAKKLYRYLSATIDLTRKILKAVSLVNFPAVKGLTPLELSEGIYTFAKEDAMAETVEQIKERVRQELLTEFAAREKQLTELRAQVRQEVEAELAAQFARKAALTEFAAGVCARSSVQVETLVEFLASLSEAQLEQAKAILTAPPIEFGERGSDGDGQTHSDKLPLPDEYRAALRAGTLTMADLNSPLLDLGELSRYDLSEFNQ